MLKTLQEYRQRHDNIRHRPEVSAFLVLDMLACLARLLMPIFQQSGNLTGHRRIGARFVGKFAIGANEGIQRFTRPILFDEKIGGSFHMALGAGYPDSSSQNQCARALMNHCADIAKPADAG